VKIPIEVYEKYFKGSKANTLRKAVKSIKKHDWQQMGGKIKLL